MSGIIKKLKADNIVYYCLVLGAMLQLISLLVAGFFYSKLPPLLPIFNQMPWGEARLGSTMQIFIPIGIAFIFYLINTIVTYTIYDKMPLMSRILSVTLLLICIFSFLLCIRTLDLVI